MSGVPAGFNDAEGGAQYGGFMSFPASAQSNAFGHQPAAFATQWASASPLGGEMSTPGLPTASHQRSFDEEDYENERPLLQELGVDFSHIAAKVYGVLNVTKKIDESIMADTDMAGPICFALILGTCLLLTGKVHFGYIYGFGMLGCIAVYLIVNLMSESATLDVARTISILGYCLLPIVALAGVAVVYDLRGVPGAVMGASAVLWCTQSATRFFEGAMHMREQRYLIAYPTFLLYACFALMTIF